MRSNGFKTGIAAVIGTGLLVVTPTISSAHSPDGWNICPAIDTEPACELVAQATSNGPGYGPVNRVDRAPSSDCFAPDRSPTAGDVSACSQHRPDDENANGTAELIDIPDYNCDEWRNPVIACPGNANDTAELIDIPDYNCDEWRNPVIACPGNANDTAELIDIPDYNCDEWRNPVIACPG